MLTIKYKNSFFNFCERIGIQDVQDLLDEKTDVLVKLELTFVEPSAPVLKSQTFKNAFELSIPNFLVNLKQEEEELFRNMSKSVRADIRKAQDKHQFTYMEIDQPTVEELQEFSRLYDSFAKSKNISPCNLDKLFALRGQNALILTKVVDREEHTLCSGILIEDRGNNQIYGLYGVSDTNPNMTGEERRIIGRANKLLQWKEMQSAKRRGVNWYNFGGEVNELNGQGVNDFKKRFGTISGYDRRIYIPRSFLGRICVYFLYLRWKKKYISIQQTVLT